ncbi:methyltransferase domain-containing protein [Winogradskyella sp. DF17]|uniref:Methyltransferase domain-containing protein n=1 Tax=Winogradskyella pelagia TaxID=2819984 RepID=A0ABS3T6C3_9FLAO|nr:methyltransferase domain-containing protein [Winogradskyella sp. DF17]MBO3117849.1 methyltransferase domain-containing protein [Winogradskyella sp. DF17]
MILNKEYWKKRYKDKTTGWDIGFVSPPMKNFIDGLQDKTAKILVPGSGNGYEVEYLWQNGFKNVFAADYAELPLIHLKKRMPSFPETQLIHSDFFEIDQSFDIILEQTFFCALNPSLRPLYAEKMDALLKPKGILAGLLFKFPLTTSGPPFGGSINEYEELFKSKFHLHKLETAYNSLQERAGKELFFIFEKKST